MAIEYTLKINAVRVHNVGELQNVVKEVDVTMKGTDSGCSFELPFSVNVGDPAPENFVDFSQLTAAEVEAWVWSQEDQLAPYQAHIAYVVAKEVEKAALEQKPLPWAPEPEAPAAPANAAA
jgi:hypothetical protein